MGLIQLSGSIKFQILSFLTLVFITIVWIMTFFQVGITNFPIPAIGTSQASVVGYVISNFAFVSIISVQSWIPRRLTRPLSYPL
jgi:hypothetical protein